jgi:hypothetical protein
LGEDVDDKNVLDQLTFRIAADMIKGLEASKVNSVNADGPNKGNLLVVLIFSQYVLFVYWK